ncbi:MerR family transcriptional regulator [Streptomyces yaizuensis]|uniref:MerR family transcriptional regulator n=1 Tax=Streptomyces yaizuensis TaxID=2989713 RepID=A0ABQ5P0Y4_9ACTN|nr:MerR family transcriptional regulator [Streptomyces sp. YSPA8]GLF96271.1 MerR family transcriptional regulator [Streptomyces sp. YSPA8]
MAGALRIGELSRRTGVPVPTIKYYLREGLLQAGQLTSPNQADYGETHEHRLRLIRALVDVGGLRVAAVADVLAAVDDPDLSVYKVLGVGTDLLVPQYAEGERDEVLAAARKRVGELIERRGWHVGHDCPARESLAAALAALERLGRGDFADVLDVYAEAADGMALADLDYVTVDRDRDGVVERAIIGTAVGASMITSLRHLAHVNRSAQLFGHPTGHGGGGDGDAGAGADGGGGGNAGTDPGAGDPSGAG